MLSFTPAGSYAAAANLNGIVAADFNNDGKLDLASAGGFSATRVDVRLGDGAGGFGAAQENVFGWGYPTSIAAADFNNDSKLDIVVTDLSGCSILMGDGDGTFQTAVEAASGDGVHVALGHFNNDGNLDLVVGGHHWEFGLYYQPYLGNGEGGFTAGQFEYIGGDPYNWNDMLAAVELNNDGKLDVVIGDGRVLLGNGNGTFQYDYGQPAPVSSGAIATGDFTGDGYADVIVTGISIKVLRSRGDGTFGAPIYSSGTGGAVATANFNADGKLDAIVVTGDAATVSVLLGNGDGTVHYASAYATGTLPSGIAVGDFNGDGRPDVAVANKTSQTISVLLNDGVWPDVGPTLPGDFDFDSDVDGADFLSWQRGECPNAGSAEDLADWQANFGQTLPTPGAGSGVNAVAETNSPSLQLSDATQAVGLRGASENQWATLARETAFVELAAPLTRGRAKIRHILRTSSSAASFEDSQPNSALLRWLSQADLDRTIETWPKGKMVEFDQTSDADDSVLESVDKVIAQIISDWTVGNVLNSTSR